MAREKDFDLRAALAKPSFTPGQRDIGALIELIATDETAAVRASPALAKLGGAARTALIDAIDSPAVRSAASADAASTAAASTVEDGGAARLVATFGLVARAGDCEAR
jgi:hypothetical protein